jgi:hypothetical protein
MTRIFIISKSATSGECDSYSLISPKVSEAVTQNNFPITDSLISHHIAEKRL